MTALLVALTALGGVSGVLAVWLAAGRVATQLWQQQKEMSELNLVDVFEAAMGEDDSPAAIRVRQREKRFRTRKGRDVSDPEPWKTKREFLRAELAAPAWFAIAGASLSTLAGVLSLLFPPA